MGDLKTHFSFAFQLPACGAVFGGKAKMPIEGERALLIIRGTEKGWEAVERESATRRRFTVRRDGSGARIYPINFCPLNQQREWRPRHTPASLPRRMERHLVPPAVILHVVVFV